MTCNIHILYIGLNVEIECSSKDGINFRDTLHGRKIYARDQRDLREELILGSWRTYMYVFK